MRRRRKAVAVHGGRWWLCWPGRESCMRKTKRGWNEMQIFHSFLREFNTIICHKIYLSSYCKHDPFNIMTPPPHPSSQQMRHTQFVTPLLDEAWQDLRTCPGKFPSCQIITKIFSAVITKNRNVAYELTIKFVFFKFIIPNTLIIKTITH